MIFAGEKEVFPAYTAISGLLVIIILFFWGVYKAIKTQRLVYMLALLPFAIFLSWMFFI